MPISDCEVRDPRIRRTRQLLQGALQKLMQTKSFDEISVQDIASVATVNRATFYDHYTDKFALLEALVAGSFHQLLRERDVTFDGTCPQAIGVIILAACDYLTTADAGSLCDRQSAFQPLMDAAMAAAIRRILLQGLLSKSGSNASAADLDFAAKTDQLRTDSPASSSSVVAVAESPSHASTPTSFHSELVATAASWAICGAVKQWFVTPNRPPAEEIIQPLVNLVLPMIEKAGSPKFLA